MKGEINMHMENNSAANAAIESLTSWVVRKTAMDSKSLHQQEEEDAKIGVVRHYGNCPEKIFNQGLKALYSLEGECDQDEWYTVCHKSYIIKMLNWIDWNNNSVNESLKITQDGKCVGHHTQRMN